MQDNTKRMNRQIAIAMASCSLVIVCLIIMKALHIFSFSGGLMIVLPIVGLVCLLSPLTLLKLNVPDVVLKYYMSIAMAVMIGTLGCFNGIGIYITFVLVPVASCLYFDTRYTLFCSIFSYIVMVIAVYFNSAGKMEVEYLNWSHMTTFRAYLIGFTLEYIVVALFLSLIMRRARIMLDEQHQAYIAQKAQDARYELMIKGTKDVVFEYYPGEGRYVANRSIYQDYSEENRQIIIENFEDEAANNLALMKLQTNLREGFKNNRYNEFEIDLSYEADGKLIPLWYNVECFIVKDGDIPVSVISKMHNITRTKLAQREMRERSLESMRQDSKRKNSLYEQVMAESVNFTENDYERLAQGHRFLAQIMEDVKYSENLVDGINRMLEQVAGFFMIDRICVVETDLSSGTSYVNYQWNSKEENILRDYFSQMSLEEVRRTVASYDRNGYIEINPSRNMMPSDSGNTQLLDKVVYGVILGNQIWIPMLENGKCIGTISFDRYDTTLYTSVEKFLLSEAVNTLTTLILKINAQNANKAKSDFLSTMSHEIRTPMNAIVGMTEVALREDMSDNLKRSLGTVKSSAFGLLTLINDILDYSKIEAGRFDIVPESFSLLSILNDVKEITMARNNGKLEVEFIVPSDMPIKMYGDSVRIKQVMINYCTNAIKYTDEGRVEVKVEIDKKDDRNAMLKFSVSDNGIGIKKEDLSKLFKSYTRVDTTVNHHKEGTGLGLAISKQLVELMDGNVAVESEYGKGSTFSFSIPLIIEDASPAGSLDNFSYDDSVYSEEVDISVVAPSARVLVVDDTILNLIVAESLMEPSKMKIDTAESGKEALRMIGRKDYDIVFMDHFMPEMDGIETTQRIRELEDEKKRNVPIIALTADAMEGVREELLGKGMNDFLTKPIIVGNLNQVLKKWLPKDKIEK